MSDYFDRLADLQKEERKVINAQTKLTPSESDDLDQAVQFFRDMDIPSTRASFIRAAVLDAINKVKYSKEQIRGN
ncbi:hypothetical protein SEA_FORZA_17 [Gordonia phage Forza]|uniref:Uncharacterized protein n=1 Tax=Gordonia phage Forza TaxID=2571247 RepID=A0A650EY77_9CAUD|nr:hypothetical protein PP303_gp017 [Gordonia phage Forza]QEM41486.1 hypothetical protein SEA_BOOPY_17 [Gordonia phage Boopy]QGT55010.1 hypothetical protein SEA_FORZA_17 [Gordonia phage Forza]WBF03798.1 hypothetical protein SEA_MAREELIH_15 [Gordonia phage Mareelih]